MSNDTEGMDQSQYWEHVAGRRLDLLKRCERVFDYSKQHDICPICEQKLPMWDFQEGRHAEDCELDAEIKEKCP